MVAMVLTNWGIVFLYSFFKYLLVISWLFPPMIFISYGLMFYCMYRMFSKQYYKRRAENDLYLSRTVGIRRFFNRQQNKWKYRHTHKYYKCPHCHQYLRVPKGKGEITITCPTCHQQFDNELRTVKQFFFDTKIIAHYNYFFAL